jgi:hypothetical protein
MDYRGNTDKSREQKEPKPDKQIEKVVTGEVSQKPKGIGRKFKDIFFGGDLRTTVRFVTADVLLPKLRDLVVDITFEGIKKMMYGESAYNRRPPSYPTRVQYNSPIMRDPRPYSYASRGPIPDQPHPNRVMRKESNDLVLASKEDAERIVEQLIDIIDQYEVVSWADLCALVGWPASPIDNKWGWTYLTNTEIRQTREGYVIDLPQMEAI